MHVAVSQSLLTRFTWLPSRPMNSVSLNVLLWLLLAVVALGGKLMFEHLLTRAAERKALDKARSARRVERAGVGGSSSP
jgi:hypothetical protein